MVATISQRETLIASPRLTKRLTARRNREVGKRVQPTCLRRNSSVRWRASCALAAWYDPR